ncbi:MAG: site-specific integrase [Halanaerobiales bacterium]|nr:site-specific integrase [Halanaerobiales bacterium]
MPRITEKENGKYKAFVEMGKDPSTGRRKRKAKTFNRKRDAQVWIAQKIAERDQGIVVDPGGYTVKEYLLYWLENYAESQLAGTTYDGYTMIVNTHIIPALGAIKLDQLHPMHIQTYLNKKRVKGRKDGQPGGLSEKTLLQHYRILSKSLNQAVKWQRIKYNPIRAVDAPKPEKKNKIVAMTKVQVKKLLNTVENDPWMYSFIFVALRTGMRRSELLGLRWEDVDLENKTIRVRQVLVTKMGTGTMIKGTKNLSSTRSISITDAVINVLKKHKKRQTEIRLFLQSEYNSLDLVFCKENGTIYNPSTVNKRYRKARKKAGLSDMYTIHVLRHTFATMMLKADVNPKIVQEMLGHSVISTTLDTYSHVTPNMQKEAAEKLDSVLS